MMQIANGGNHNNNQKQACHQTLANNHCQQYPFNPLYTLDEYNNVIEMHNQHQQLQCDLKDTSSLSSSSSSTTTIQQQTNTKLGILIFQQPTN
eukprot:UN10431